jgi:hypothetical protein
MRALETSHSSSDDRRGDMKGFRSLVVFGIFAVLGFAFTGRASPPSEPVALDPVVTSVSIDGVAVASPTTTFVLRDLGGGTFGGLLFDPEKETRALSLSVTP